MVFTILLIFHVLICVGLIIVVLMQSSKGEGLAGAFGGGGGISSAVFGGRGAASFLSRATTVLAILFMVSCMGLSLLSAGKGLGSSAAVSESAVTQQAQDDMAAQQQAAQQAAEQQAAGQEGALPDDIFQVEPSAGQTSDSQ